MSDTASAPDDNPPQQPRSRPPARARSFSCPACGGSVEVKAAGISVTAFCPSCGAAIDVANDNLRLISEARQHIRPTTIELGARGTLAGTEWEVVGVQMRSDASGRWPWTEYLLFNPYRGFRFLVLDHGHWTLYCLLRQDVSDPRAMWHDNRPYRLFSNGVAHTDYVLGEFYWRARMVDEVKISEYIAPPYILSREENGDEITWSRGIYLEPGLVADAFALKAMPERTGIAPNQPSPYSAEDRAALRRVALVALAVLLVLFCVRFGQDRSVEVYNQTFHTTLADRGRTLASDPFPIPGDRGNVRVTVSAPQVRNSWLITDISLVDAANDRGFSLVRKVSYYSGTDFDGFWSEGSHVSSGGFASVPGGTYRLLIQPDSGQYNGGGSVDFSVSVVRHAPSWGYFWLAAFLILAYPLIQYARQHMFEARRWQGSEIDSGITTTLPPISL